MTTLSLPPETKKTILFSLVVLAIVLAFTLAVTSVDGAIAYDVGGDQPLNALAHVP